MTQHDERGVTVSVPLPGSRPPLQAYFVAPDRPGPDPGVVMIHELFGLNENIRNIARRFAGAGYAALAVDLFSTAARVVCLLRIIHGLLVRPLVNGVVDEMRAAIDFLSTQPGVDPTRLGVIGFCMGGSYALQLACVDGDLGAAAVFYGQNPRPLNAVARACSIVGSYPERDFTARAARQLQAALRAYGVPHDIRIYPDARHSFFNDRGRAYHPQAAADAWIRTLAFFDVHLKRAQVPHGGAEA